MEFRCGLKRRKSLTSTELPSAIGFRCGLFLEAERPSLCKHSLMMGVALKIMVNTRIARIKKEEYLWIYLQAPRRSAPAIYSTIYSQSSLEMCSNKGSHLSTLCRRGIERESLWDHCCCKSKHRHFSRSSMWAMEGVTHVGDELVEFLIFRSSRQFHHNHGTTEEQGSNCVKRQGAWNMYTRLLTRLWFSSGIPDVIRSTDVE